MSNSRTLTKDPIAEAQRNWVRNGWEEASGPMAAVTAIMRVQQILLAEAEQVLKPFKLTFARYELIALLSFTREQQMLMKRASALLQVHPTSVTNAVDRLEDAGLVKREPLKTDRRAMTIVLTAKGKKTAAEATRALNEDLFLRTGFEPDEVDSLIAILSRFRARSGDFEDAPTAS
ncbi:MarR family transcriptional regulator [Kocuria sp. cx-455]|uniref:MarR family winged helix-turn-helix transcriptional regulator n=1 Tax=Kocuria sp. cx-455 TaxID=2771377 RepID=UPI001685A9F1|nr:MarR family transcriptional regulator [Kocuria sp. cx-455]MBD2765284.1 MarR family transcriptional regulator [Kocuria sp. cx-455]